MLGLQAEAGTPPVHRTAFAGVRAVEEIPRIDLHGRLGREHLQHAASGRFVHARLSPQGPVPGAKNKGMIVALADAELRLRLVDPHADRGARREVMRRTSVPVLLVSV